MKQGSEVATALILTLFSLERKFVPSIESAMEETVAPGGRAASKLLVELTAGASPRVSFCRCPHPHPSRREALVSVDLWMSFPADGSLIFPSQYWCSRTDGDGENPKTSFIY